jgi:hypothetical protein
MADAEPNAPREVAPDPIYTLALDLAQGIVDQPGLPPGFDGLQYVASHGDLIAAFGADADADAGERHYLDFGLAEGRVADTFDEARYLANYPDLQAAFGGDAAVATEHYILFGFAEGRTDDPAAAASAVDFLLG